MKKSEIAFGILKIPFDYFMTILAFMAAYHLRTVTTIAGIELPVDISLFPEMAEYLQFAFKTSIILLGLFAVNSMYSLKISAKLSRELWRVIVLSSYWLMILITYFFLIREFPFSRLAIVYTWLLAIIFISSGRILIKELQILLLKLGIGKRKILFIGDNKVTKELKMQLSKKAAFHIDGTISAKEIHRLPELIKKGKIEEIMQTESDLSEAQSTKILDFCREHHIQYHFVPDIVQVQKTNIDISSPGGIPLISLKPTSLDGWGRVMKRIFDIVGSIIGLAIFSPIFLLTSIAIKIDSRGPVLFTRLDDGERVKRVGQQGKLFNFYKFRSMRPKTHNLRYTELAKLNERKGTPMVKIKNDPRITRVGKIIRKTSLDELPQLWNVLRGDMSLVGPRPHLPEEVERYEKHHKFALTIKPGITGLAQISGRSDLNFEKEIKLDSYYIENWSLWLDIKIILKTFQVVLKGKAAD